MNASLHSINIALETYANIGRQLNAEHQGFMFHADNPLDPLEESRFSQYEHIGNEGRELGDQELHEFVSTLTEIPIVYPKIIGPIAKIEGGSKLYSRTAVEHCQGTTDLLLCEKCQKVNKGFESWTCSECGKYFHFECLPKHMRVFYADEEDPHWTIPINDILHGEKTVNPISLDDIHNYYETDGHFKIENEVLITGAVYCPDCFERSCQICHGMDASLTCCRCEARFHEDCVSNAQEGRRYLCEQCQIDGGPATVDKILAIKFLSYDQLRNIAKEELQEQLLDEYDDSKLLIDNYNLYASRGRVRTPCNVYLSDRFYFLVKLNYESYWRVKWLAHERIQVIARARLSAINLLNCLTVYHGMKREFGLDRVVQMNEINTKLGQQESNEILKLDFEDSSDSETSVVTNAETEFDTPEDNRYVSNCEFPSGFENYFHESGDDFIMEGVPPKYQAIIKEFLSVSPEFVLDAVVNYAIILHKNGVPPSFLVPNSIIARTNYTFLVRWLGGNFEESTFETIYFLLPYGRKRLVQFFLQSMGIKRCSIFQLIGLSLEHKSWVDSNPNNAVKGRLGEYRPLIATPPYLLLDGKNLYDFELTGINWLLFTHSIKRGVLFCDEMGLGKSIEVCGFMAALTEQGCFGPHLIVCPTSTLNNWVRELGKWVPFLSIGLLEVTDMVGIEITLKTCIKSHMHMFYEKSAATGKDIGVSISQTNSDNDAICRASRKKIIDEIVDLVHNQDNIDNWEKCPESTSQLCFSPISARDYNGSQHYDVVILSYETSTNLFRKRMDSIQYRDSQGKVYTKTHSSYFQALMESMGPFSTLICDEGHRLKGGLKNQVFAVLDHIQCKQRIILTGTPIENNFEEFTNLLSFIDPNYFTENKCNYLIELATNASNPGFSADERKEAVNKLNEMVKPHVLIRSHEDVFEDPVVKAEIFIPVDMTRRQKLIYSKILYDDRFKLTEKKLFKQRASILRNTAVSLRHICNHPVLLDRRYQSIITKMDIEEFLDMSAKMKMVDRLLIGIHSRGRKVLIFSEFVMVLNTLEILLKKRAYNFLRLDGSIHSADREQLIDKFNDPANSYTVFILSTNSGGMGINLETAEDVIIFDASWNPENDLQAQYRAARIGQKEIVRVYKIFCRETIDQRILERAKEKLSLSYILVKPLSGISKIDDKDNMDDILNYGSENLLKSFRDMNQEMVKIGEFFEGGIDFESEKFKGFMKAVEDKEIEYEDVEIDRLLDMEPVELAAEQTKCLRPDATEQADDMSGALNKNEFFAAFRIAEFKVGKKEEKDEIIATQAREKKKPTLQPKSTGIVADNTKYWTELFTTTFGEEVLKPTEKEEEQVELTEIDTELSVFKPNVPKNTKPKDKYVHNETEIPVIKFLIAPEMGQYSLETGFVFNTVDELIDVSTRAVIQYDMNEATVRQVIHIAHQLLSTEPEELQDCFIDVVKFAFASPVFTCAAINHRELYKLEFDHKTELCASVVKFRELVSTPELFVINELLDGANGDVLRCMDGWESVLDDINANKASKTLFEYPGVFQFAQRNREDQTLVVVNEMALLEEKYARRTSVDAFWEAMSVTSPAGISCMSYCCNSLVSSVTPGKFNLPLVGLLRRWTAYYFKVYITEICSHIQTISAIDFAFNVIYFRRACVEVLRKFEMSGSDYSAVERETGVDVQRIAARTADQSQGLTTVQPRQLPVAGASFTMNFVEPEVNRLTAIIMKQQNVRAMVFDISEMDPDYHVKFVAASKQRDSSVFYRNIIAFIIICSMFGFVNPHHISLSQQTEKYIHIINYNDELDAEYDMLESSYARPRPEICVQSHKFDSENSCWEQIMRLSFKFTEIEVSLQARRRFLSQADGDNLVHILRSEQEEFVEEIEILKKRLNERELARYIFVNYIKGSVAATVCGDNISERPEELCTNPKGEKEGFWHPFNSYAFGVTYEQRKLLWRFFRRCGLPVDPEVFRLYKSRLGQQGAIGSVIEAVGEVQFDEKFVKMNQFFRDRILALFEAKLSLCANPDITLSKYEPYLTLLSKGAPICWKNLPFDFFITELEKEELFLLLFQCVVMDGCKDFLKSVLFNPGTEEKAVLEALVQLPVIEEADCAAFGLANGAAEEPLPMFTKNRVIANEKRRSLIQEEYEQYVALYLPKVKTLLPETVVSFVRETAENQWLSLICGLITLALFRYGFDGFKKWVMVDQSINLQQVLRNAMETMRVRNDRFEKSNAFMISEAQRLICSCQIADIDKCMLVAAIMSAFFMAAQFAKHEGEGTDFGRRYWDCVMQEGSSDVWHAMQEFIGRNWTDELQDSSEMRRELEGIVTWFSEFKFTGIVDECYPKEK